MPKISNSAIEAATPQVEAESKPAWVWLSIPTRDLTDYPFDGVSINQYHFGAISAANKRCDCGDFPNCQNTGMHKIPAVFAEEISRRLKLFQEQSVKLFSSKVNLQALREVAFGNPSYTINAQEHATHEAKNG